MRIKKVYDEKGMIIAIQDILNSDDSSVQKINAIDRLLLGRKGTMGGGKTKELYGRAHYVDMVNKRWATARSIKSTIKTQ